MATREIAQANKSLLNYPVLLVDEKEEMRKVKDFFNEGKGYRKKQEQNKKGNSNETKLNQHGNMKN